jgi:hypothetical protein
VLVIMSAKGWTRRGELILIEKLKACFGETPKPTPETGVLPRLTRARARNRNRNRNRHLTSEP